MILSVCERNLVSIYHSGTRAATLRQLQEALPYMEEYDAQEARALIGKLAGMGDSAFLALALTLEGDG